MVTLLETPNMDKKTRYLLMKSPDMHKMRESVGTRIEVKCFNIRDDDRIGEDGEVVHNHVISIMDASGAIYTTNSITFIREFTDMYDVFGEDDLHHIEVVGGRSRAGRNYVSCKYID